MSEDLYLGVDGGQSHTEAVVADSEGNILGRGHGGPSNHVEQPGGRERLRQAIVDSVGGALRAARPVVGTSSISNTVFAAAHCAMTGEANFKEEIVQSILHAHHLVVGHDAPAALAGATGGEPGVVVIAGTGSVAYGENRRGDRARAGGWGYLFGDEGSGFWVARAGLRQAMLAQDGLREATSLRELALKYFNCSDLQAIEVAVVCNQITRDRFASFAEEVHKAAVEGEEAAREVVTEAGRSLAALAVVVARRLNFAAEEARISYVGGMFRGRLVHEAFHRALQAQMPSAQIIAPRFDPATGALLLAYRAAGHTLMSEDLQSNLDKQPIY